MVLSDYCNRTSRKTLARHINTRMLPVPLRPPMWRRVALVGMVVFYGFFLALLVRSFV
jgi:hypothetical protein